MKFTDRFYQLAPRVRALLVALPLWGFFISLLVLVGLPLDSFVPLGNVTAYWFSVLLALISPFFVVSFAAWLGSQRGSIVNEIYFPLDWLRRRPLLLIPIILLEGSLAMWGLTPYSHEHHGIAVVIGTFILLSACLATMYSSMRWGNEFDWPDLFFYSMLWLTLTLVGTMILFPHVAALLF